MPNHPTLSSWDTLIDALYYRAEHDGELEAYRFISAPEDHQSVTYWQLLQDAEAIARRLQLQADPGDRAVLMYTSGLDFIRALYGCLLAGIIAVPAYPPKQHRGGERVVNILRDCSPRLVLCHESTLHAVAELCGSLKNKFCIVATNRLEYSPSTQFFSSSQGTTAIVQYTSGSTSLPKGVSLTHANIMSNVSALRRAFCFDQNSVFFSWLPMFHDMCLVGSIMTPLVSGVRSIFIAPSSFIRHPLNWLSNVSAYRVTHTGGPNFAFDLCVNRIKEDQLAHLDLSSLKNLYCGGEPIFAETLDRFSYKFASCGFSRDVFFPSYGMAEATLYVSGGPMSSGYKTLSVSPTDLEVGRVKTDPDGVQLVGCGQVSDSFQVRIVNPDTNDECSQCEIGEVWLQGDSVFSGYYNEPSTTPSVFVALAGCEDGVWFRSGDLGFMHDSLLYIVGRLNDIIILNGRNIYPQDVERAMAEALQLKTANSVAAFGVGELGASTVAVLVEPSREDYRTLCQNIWYSRDSDSPIAQIDLQVRSAQEQIHKALGVVLGGIGFVRPGSFPRTSSGKVARTLAKSIYLRAEYVAIQSSVQDNRSFLIDSAFFPQGSMESE